MSKRAISAVTAVLVAVLAFIAATQIGRQDAEHVPTIQGKNNTALFVVLPHHGLSNVHLATAQALMERHPEIKIQFVSFPTHLEGKLKRISAAALKRNPNAQPIDFRALSGRNYDDIVTETNGASIENYMAPPGVAGIRKFCDDVQLYISPWPAQEHFDLYSEISQVIADVDPAVIVLDSLFAPAIDAARDSNRLHATISPNTVVDNFASQQPWGGMFWKYPNMGSGLPFPIPWYYIPSNTYQVVRFIARMLYTPEITEKKKFLREHGVKNPIDFFHMHHEDSPWITQTLPGASVPIEYMPRNVSTVGPIVISVAPAEEQDPKLYEWLGNAPTILINLGSSVEYTEERATIMAGAVKQILDQSDVQILWKLAKFGNYSDDFAAPLKEYIASGRLKLEKWLTVDPTSILESGRIVAFVHHGGANCYHEGIIGGVPHIILPLWVDLYNFAALVETLNIGVWACPKTSPFWNSECISEAVLKVVKDSDESKAMREKAHHLGEVAKSSPGRYGSAKIIAQLAGSGY